MGPAGGSRGKCKKYGRRGRGESASSYGIRSGLRAGNAGDEAEGVTVFYDGQVGRKGANCGCRVSAEGIPPDCTLLAQAFTSSSEPIISSCALMACRLAD